MGVLKTSVQARYRFSSCWLGNQWCSQTSNFGGEKERGTPVPPLRSVTVGKPEMSVTRLLMKEKVWRKYHQFSYGKFIWETEWVDFLREMHLLSKRSNYNSGKIFRHTKAFFVRHSPEYKCQQQTGSLSAGYRPDNWHMQNLFPDADKKEPQILYSS